MSNPEAFLAKWESPNLSADEKRNTFIHVNKELLPIVQKALMAPKESRGAIYTKLNNAFNNNIRKYFTQLKPTPNARYLVF